MSIARTAGDATATAASSSSVSVDAGFGGLSSFTYTVRGSLNATSTGQLTVTVSFTHAYCQSNIRYADFGPVSARSSGSGELRPRVDE